MNSDESTSSPQLKEKENIQNHIDLEKCVTVLVTEAQEPFTHLALLRLQAVPRPGDLINISVGSAIATYSVIYVNFNPYEPRCHITLGCTFSPRATPAGGGTSNTVDLKERMEHITKSNIQFFEKAQAYTNAILLAGYAGVFGLWTFSKNYMTAFASNLTVILAGISLLLFITWEIFQMVKRSYAMANFVRLVNKTPQEFFELLSKQEAHNREASGRSMLIWKVVLVPTIFCAYAAALLLLYSAARNLFGSTPLP